MKPLVVLDCEVYRDYFVCKLRTLEGRITRVFEMYDGHPLDVDRLRKTLQRITAITFNGRNYDGPIIAYALLGATCEELKHCSNMIIEAGMRPWDIEREFNIKLSVMDQIDLIDVKPTFVSLKVLMGRLNCRRMQDLPIEHTASITPEMRPVLLDYNDNDLDGTEALFHKFRKQIDLRIAMSEIYKVDLRSKSDAQIAEAVIRHGFEEKGIRVQKPTVNARSFKLRFPAFLDHAGPITKSTIDLVGQCDFIVDTAGYVKMPKQLAAQNIRIGNGVYRIGIGGLHSSEKRQAVRATDEILIADRDVTSYYPEIIAKTGLYPSHLGEEFLDIYKKILAERVAAKRAGDKSKADTLKIVVNGAFGKFGNPYSILYSPDLLMQTTVIGQLTLLMLIEMIEASTSARVVSGNTDGIVIKALRREYDELAEVVQQWESFTGFTTEEVRYNGLFSRDVNSYIALKEGGGAKLKGAYAPSEPVASSWPSPHNQICVTAVCDYLEHNIPIDLTISTCVDITQMVEVRNVTGGAVWRSEYLGRAVRWYKSKDGEPIYYKKNGNKVPKTDGCRPLMTMDGSIPEDIDIDAYVRDAQQILIDIGAEG